MTEEQFERLVDAIYEAKNSAISEIEQMQNNLRIELIEKMNEIQSKKINSIPFSQGD